MTLLHENTTKPSTRCIIVHIEGLCDVRLCQNRGRSQQLLQSLERFITLSIPDKFLLFLQKIRDGFGNLGKVQKKSVIVASQAEKASDLMHSPWWPPIQHLSNLARIHRYSPRRYHVTLELNFGQPELAPAELHTQLMITQSLKHNVEMLFMLILTFRKDQDVIYEYHDKHVQLFHENRVHQVHEVSRGVHQTKKHHQILIKTVSGGESSLWDIFFTDLDLMIARTKVNLQKDLCSNQLIKQEINAGQWILVLHGYCVEWSIIDAQPLGLVLFRHKDSRATPWRIGGVTPTFYKNKIFVQIKMHIKL
jgi:hypothetical protein